MKAQLSAMAALLLAGCASFKPEPVRPGPIDEPPAVARIASPRAAGGGVFREGGLSLTSDSRAFRVGDVVTVILQETTQASKSAGTKASKDTSLGVAPPSLLGKTFNKGGIDLSASRSFEGDSSSTQANALSGSITVIVQEVLPNGLLRVAGEKALTLNQGEEFVRLRGFLRPADIDSSNQVSSLRIANARIAYSAQGTLAEAQQPGWLTRFFLGPLMPF
ncbi:flagellar basal body L-ring protein FlgH [Massilia endophytica]|uniref:flagellar basal body L-ring protein FlgH n=1 Tax=Massilia endophytica TaxID=2899220 RepID=UPI001E41CBB6|nr:flagellar basal body L-ring protein FlgH [Massilia endophytica]UGQ48983.1 flagellar basal body L-ring protein FlgH [Massilia endophytica]